MKLFTNMKATQKTEEKYLLEMITHRYDGLLPWNRGNPWGTSAGGFSTRERRQMNGGTLARPAG